MKYTRSTSHDCGTPRTPLSVIIEQQTGNRINRFEFDTELKRVMSSPVHMPFRTGDKLPDDKVPGTPSIAGCSDGYAQIEPCIGNNASTADLISVENGPYIFAHMQPRRKQLYSIGSATTIEPNDIPNRVSLSRCSCYVIVFIVLLSLILSSVCLGIIFVLWGRCNTLENQITSTQSSYTSAQNDPHMCLPCSELKQGPFDEDNEELNTLIQRDEGGVTTCCAKTPEQMSTLLNLFAKRKQLQKCAQELLKENSTGNCSHSAPGGPTSITPGTSRISAHVRAGQQPTTVTGNQPVRNWQVKHVDGVALSDDRLVIPANGTYYVYSQVGFFLYYEDQETEDSQQSLFHTVLRYNPIYPLGGSEELLRSETSQCWETNKDFGRYTSYVGAALKLIKGDQIYVKASRISKLSRKLNMNYFGLFKLN